MSWIPGFILVSDYLFSLGCCLSIALLVAFRAGEINSLNLEEKVDDLTRGALQEKIVAQLEILLRVYRDTTESVTLPLGVNLQEVAARCFFHNESIQWLNSIYLDLVNQGTGSPHFAQALFIQLEIS